MKNGAAPQLFGDFYHFFGDFWEMVTYSGHYLVGTYFNVKKEDLKYM